MKDKHTDREREKETGTLGDRYIEKETDTHLVGRDLSELPGWEAWITDKQRDRQADRERHTPGGQEPESYPIGSRGRSTSVVQWKSCERSAALGVTEAPPISD